MAPSPRNSVKARRICFDTHRREDQMGIYLTCHWCGGRIRPAIESWRADHSERHAEGGAESAENLWPIHTRCDSGPEGKAARDTREVAKGKRVMEKHFHIREKGNSFRRPPGVKFDWKRGRYSKGDDVDG
jgi:hypothetical protein